MMGRFVSFFLIPAGFALTLFGGATWSMAQSDAPSPVDMAATGRNTWDIKADLARALAERRQADRRAARFTQQSEQASEAAQKAARQSAALAARIQSAEADIAAARARHALAKAQGDALRARLTQRRQPLARLTGALQVNARRPLALSALQPGSLEDLVHVRAVLASAIPRIRQQTSGLRQDLARRERFEQRAAKALADLRASEAQLESRRTALAALENRERIASRDARRTASRERNRALTLVEEARDLDGLMAQLDDAARLRRDLAALPGPIFRPDDIGAPVAAGTGGVARIEAVGGQSELSDYRLPVQGRILAGFGEQRASGLRMTGVTIAPIPGAQVVAPDAGRIVFAGPYRGYGRIVIIEHASGWTSLVTGLSRVQATIGNTVIAGAPVGVAANKDPAITVELRNGGEPVNPLTFVDPR